MRAGWLLRRAGCFGPGAACEAIRGYGFVLQPTDTARAVRTYQVQLVRARPLQLPRLAASGV